MGGQDCSKVPLRIGTAITHHVTYDGVNYETITAEELARGRLSLDEYRRRRERGRAGNGGRKQGGE